MEKGDGALMFIQKCRKRFFKQPLYQRNILRYSRQLFQGKDALLKTGTPGFRQPFKTVKTEKSFVFQNICKNGNTDSFIDAKLKNQAIQSCLGRGIAQKLFPVAPWKWNAFLLHMLVNKIGTFQSSF